VICRQMKHPIAGANGESLTYARSVVNARRRSTTSWSREQPLNDLEWDGGRHRRL